MNKTTLTGKKGSVIAAFCNLSYLSLNWILNFPLSFSMVIVPCINKQVQNWTLPFTKWWCQDWYSWRDSWNIHFHKLFAPCTHYPYIQLWEVRKLGLFKSLYMPCFSLLNIYKSPTPSVICYSKCLGKSDQSSTVAISRRLVSSLFMLMTHVPCLHGDPIAGSDPPFAPPCKRNTPAPIAGSDPPFALLLKGRVRPQMRGLTPHFSCV